MIKKINKVFLESKIYNAKYVYMYTDFRNFFYLSKGQPKKLINKFLNLFLKKGITCVIPAFSYTKKNKFDIKKTKSNVGFLGNYILNNLKHSRSEHPIFSYIAIGKNKKIVKKIGKSAFGNNSVHYRLFNKNCYFLHFNRPFSEGNTLVHHIEQKNKAKYRYDKKFITKVYDKNKYLGKNYKGYVRKDMNNIKTKFTFKKVTKELKKKNYFFNYSDKSININIYPYDNFYKDLDNLFLKNNNIFVRDKKK